MYLLLWSVPDVEIVFKSKTFLPDITGKPMSPTDWSPLFTGPFVIGES